MANLITSDDVEHTVFCVNGNAQRAACHDGDDERYDSVSLSDCALCSAWYSIVGGQLPVPLIHLLDTKFKYGQ
jgi:hypothetical protein